jgi:hypothetical protein
VGRTPRVEKLTMTHPRPLLCLALASTTLACGTHPEPKLTEQYDAGPSFIAVEGDFAGFTSWEAFDGGTQTNDMLDGGQRTIYLKERPPHGSREWPLGTIVVKTTEGAQTFAMVKRGGGFNPYLPGWEWFEIALTDGNPVIVWRGTGPAGTLGYGNMPPTGCNACHLDAYENDFVFGPAIQLSSF